MAEYSVQIPVTACIEVIVEAESKEEAIVKALEKCTLEDIVEWQAHKIVCEGNIYHGIINEIDVMEE